MTYHKRLDAGKVRSLLKDDAPQGRHSDGEGLYLRVGPKAARRWVLIYTSSGKRREMGLGSAHTIGLAKARELAAASRTKIVDGTDPIIDRKVERARPTFGELTDKFLEQKQSEWKSAKHRKQWEATLRTYAPRLADRRVDTITLEDVLGVLRPIWETKTETASRVRGRIERILDMAIASNHMSGPNPARWKGAVGAHLSSPGKRKKRHYPAMPYRKLPDFFSALQKREGVSARALEFTILTAARSGEIRGATWAEIDLDNALWQIPGERMKAGREHMVPLSASALAVLTRMKPLCEALGAELVFPGRKNRPLSNSSLSAVLKRMGVPKGTATVHGFRSSFRDWAFEKTEHAHEIIETALAHAVGDQTTRAYLRGNATERRLVLMTDWADFLSQNNNKSGVIR